MLCICLAEFAWGERDAPNEVECTCDGCDDVTNLILKLQGVMTEMHNSIKLTILFFEQDR